MNLHVDDDDLSNMVIRYVASRIEEQIGQYLRHQLKGVVEAKLSSLRLLDPNSHDLGAVLTEALGGLIRKQIVEEVPILVRAELKKHFQLMATYS